MAHETASTEEDDLPGSPKIGTPGGGFNLRRKRIKRTVTAGFDLDLDDDDIGNTAHMPHIS